MTIGFKAIIKYAQVSLQTKMLYIFSTTHHSFCAAWFQINDIWFRAHIMKLYVTQFEWSHPVVLSEYLLYYNMFPSTQLTLKV